MGEIRNAYQILIETLKRRERFEYLDLDGNIILKWVLKK
jgi:hypothetical protein